MASSLKLRAVDAEDLRVIAACLQDALLPVSDLRWLPDDRAFVLVANRFLWEAPRSADGSAARTLVGVTFGEVESVRYRGIDRDRPDTLLSLLDVTEVEGGLELVFSGAASIRLETVRIDVRLSDLVEPWPTAWRPEH